MDTHSRNSTQPAQCDIIFERGMEEKKKKKRKEQNYIVRACVRITDIFAKSIQREEDRLCSVSHVIDTCAIHSANFSRRVEK